MRRPPNAAQVQAYRGFESLSLRQSADSTPRLGNIRYAAGLRLGPWDTLRREGRSVSSTNCRTLIFKIPYRVADSTPAQVVRIEMATWRDGVPIGLRLGEEAF